MPNTPHALDPLAGRPAPSHQGSISAAVDVLAPLLGIDADSPEGDQLRQHLLDMDGSLTTATSASSASSRELPSAAFAGREPRLVRPFNASRRSSAEVALAAQRADAWRAALAHGEIPE